MEFQAHRIATITLNPTVDYSTGIDSLVPDIKLRCDPPASDPGGGGVNVSRAIRILGGQSRAVVAVGGGLGDALLQMLEAERIHTISVPVDGETRLSLAVTERRSNEQYRFVMPGPKWDDRRADIAFEAIAGLAGRDDLLVLSGSLPPGLALDFPRRVAALAGRERARLVVDISGEPLLRMMQKPPVRLFLARMNRHEAQLLAGRELPSARESGAFAAGLVAQGVAEMVIVARGEEGSVLARREGAVLCRAPPVKTVSRVGAGDSFVGAFCLAIACGEDPVTALRQGTAAAAAACLTPATELCRREDAERLLGDCVDEPL